MLVEEEELEEVEVEEDFVEAHQEETFDRVEFVTSISLSVSHLMFLKCSLR